MYKYFTANTTKVVYIYNLYAINSLMVVEREYHRYND